MVARSATAASVRCAACAGPAGPDTAEGDPIMAAVTKAKGTKKATTKRTAKDKAPTAAIVPTKATPKTKATAKAKPLSGLGAAAQVLKDAGEPMRCKDVVDTMLAKGLWKSGGKTPAATVYVAILRKIDKKGSQSRFRKTDRGTFAYNG
jgi:hypothetical protein